MNSLTPRERQVLAGLASPRTDSQIAGALGISPATLKHHKGNIYRKMDVPNRVTAVLEAIRHGLVDVPGIVAKAD